MFLLNTVYLLLLPFILCLAVALGVELLHTVTLAGTNEAV